ncbi:hypothetical protein [Salinarchaeum laminariae]|uniref:hypothetical protein n=1 Tax=Salinarchaeum laminariae TaxID=869888 RepID=UPI0020BF84F6|nr:hypothetical protein [Salinarchaeum laminariae]
MCSGAPVAAMFGLLIGPPLWKWPRGIAKFQEWFDAIGRASAGPVEPAEWKVGMTYVTGIGLTIVGILGAAVCFLL